MTSRTDPRNGDRQDFGHGAVVERREVLDGRIWMRYPVRVVADSPRLVALYLSQGTELGFGKGPFSWGPHPWQQIGDRWQSPGVLQLHRPGQGHSVWVLKDPVTGAFRQWYVNLEAPLQRSGTGFSTLDHEIDLLVAEGASDCRWKDVEKFELRVREGHFSPREAASIRAEATRVARSIAEGTQWWPPSWSWWQAPDDWGPLSLQTKNWAGIRI